MSVYIKKIFKSKWVVEYGFRKKGLLWFLPQDGKNISKPFWMKWSKPNGKLKRCMREMSPFLQSNNTFLFSFCVVATIICCDIFSLINHTATTRFLFSFFGKEEGVRDSQTKAIMQMFSTTSSPSSSDLAKTILPHISLS